MKIRIAVVTTSTGGYAAQDIGPDGRGAPDWPFLEECEVDAGDLCDWCRKHGQPTATDEGAEDCDRADCPVGKGATRRNRCKTYPI